MGTFVFGARGVGVRPGIDTCESHSILSNQGRQPVNEKALYFFVIPGDSESRKFISVQRNIYVLLRMKISDLLLLPPRIPLTLPATISYGV